MKPSNLYSSLRSNIYRTFRYSAMYHWYARMFRPAYARAVAADRVFFRNLFTEYKIKSVFDIGANIGDKADVFHRLADRVVCGEADPDTAATLRYRFRGRQNVVVETAAVGDRIGQAELHRKPHSGFNTLSPKWAETLDSRSLVTSEVVSVPLITLDRLIEMHGRPDYIKIDVEGYELPVILGLGSPVRALSFECNLPTFRAETAEIVSRLLSLDSNVVFNARIGDAPGWAWPAPVPSSELNRLLDTVGTLDLFVLRPWQL